MFKFLKKHHLPLIAIAVVMLFFIFIILKIDSSFRSFFRENNIVETPESKTAIRKIDGVAILEEQNIYLRPFAFMVDNHVEARPAVGLDKASVVYEVEAEGGITRYLAIFDPKNIPERVGPIRSIRPYFIDFALEWDAIVVHCGGSRDALEKIKNTDAENLNEYSADGNYFWRDYGLVAPHNLFTSRNLLGKAVLERNLRQSAEFIPWKFSQEQKNIWNNLSDRDLTEEIRVKFLDSDYDVKYLYNAKQNRYLRYLADQPQRLDNGNYIYADNIILQYTEKEILDDIGRLWVRTEGEGEAEIYKNGQKISGRWKNSDNRTIFFDNNGIEIKLNPGATWIEVIF